MSPSSRSATTVISQASLSQSRLSAKARSRAERRAFAAVAAPAMPFPNVLVCSVLAVLGCREKNVWG